jgi:hypothetical protein
MMSLCGCIHAVHVIIYVVNYALLVIQKTQSKQCLQTSGLAYDWLR